MLNSGTRGRLIGQIGVSRRNVLKIGGALATASMLPSFGFAQETPTRGGHLRFGSYGAATSGILDPTTYFSNFLMFAGACWGNGLTMIDPNGDLQPELAESWEMSDAGRKFVIKLRSGIEFHNGKPLTVEDVIYSMERHRVPGVTSGLGQAFAGMDITKTDDLELTLVLPTPNVDLMFNFADYHMLIQPEGEAVDAGIGTGPYVVQSHQNGVSLELIRNENYFKPDAAYLDSITILGLNDTTGRVSALQTGEVDLIVGVPPRLQTLLQGGGFATFRVPASGFAGFGINLTQAPFDNVDLRLALKYAINREELQSTVWDGAGNIGNDHPVAPMVKFRNTELPQRAYDPEQAKFHFDKSGAAGNLPPMTIGDGVFLGSQEASELYQQQCIAAGIPLELNRVPADGYWANPNLGPFRLTSIFGRATADQMLTYWYGAGSNQAALEFADGRVTEMVMAAKGIVDEDVRRQTYWDIQELVHNEGGTAMPWHQQWELAGNTNIRGFGMSHLGDGKFFEKLYLA